MSCADQEGDGDADVRSSSAGKTLEFRFLSHPGCDSSNWSGLTRPVERGFPSKWEMLVGRIHLSTENIRYVKGHQSE